MDIQLTLNTVPFDFSNLSLDNLVSLFVLGIVFLTLVLGNMRKVEE